MMKLWFKHRIKHYVTSQMYFRLLCGCLSYAKIFILSTQRILADSPSRSWICWPGPFSDFRTNTLSPNLKHSSHTTVRPRAVDVCSYRALIALAFLCDRTGDGANSLSVLLKPFQQRSIDTNLLYAFFWVINRRLEFICRRFGTHCLFHLHRQVDVGRKLQDTSVSLFFPVRLSSCAYKIFLFFYFTQSWIQQIKRFQLSAFSIMI